MGLEVNQLCVVKFSMAFFNLANRPDIAVSNVVQGRHHADGPGLPNIAERGQIARPEPTPSLSHFMLPLQSAKAPI